MLYKAVCVVLFILSVNGQSPWKVSSTFPNAVTVELESTKFGGTKVFEGESLMTEYNEAQEKVLSEEPSFEDLKSELSFRDVLPDGKQFLTTVSDSSIIKMLETKEGQTSVCQGKTCLGNEENERVISEGDDLMRRLRIASEDESTRRMQVLGDDDRWEVKGNPIAWSPPKHSGLLTFSGGFCSAALVGPRHILTAGHCVHEGDGGDWYGNFKFYPGRNSWDSSSAFGWSRARTYAGWANSGDWNHDLAIIELSSSPNIGYISFGWTNIKEGDYLYLKGYPGDKPYGSQWSTSDSLYDLKSHQLRTDSSDATPGMSGSPVYEYENSIPIIKATHSGWGRVWWYFKQYHRHTRITQSKFNSMCDFINDCDVCPFYC